MSTQITFIRFNSENARLNFTFLHPQDWQVLQSRGAKTNYDEVMIVGPRNRQNTYNLALTVRVTPLSQQDGLFPTLDVLVTDYLARHRYPFREISRAKGSLAGCNAVEIEIGYTMPLPINSANSQETPMIEHRVFLQKDGNLYELIFRAVEEDYFKYLDAFWNAARTFEFRAETETQFHHQAVIPTPAPAHAFAEKREDYETKK